MCRGFKVISVFTKIWLAILLASVAGLSTVQAEPTVSGIRVGEHRSYTRVVIDLSDSAAYEVRSLVEPYRIYIDFKESRVKLAQAIPGDVGLVSGIRYGRLPNGDARVVFDTRGPARVLSAQIYPPLGRLGHRLAIDLQRQSPAAYSHTVNRVLASGSGAPSAERPARPELVNAVATAQPQVSAGSETQESTTAALTETPITRVAARPTQTPDPSTAVRSAEAPSSGNLAGGGKEPDGGENAERKVGSPVRVAGLPKIAPTDKGPSNQSPVDRNDGASLGSIHGMVLRPAPNIEPPATKPPLPGPPPGMERRLVVIDPGHGGIDPGAIGAGGLREKDFTLAMSRELRDTLLASGRYDVRMTRDSDEFVRLRERVAKARGFADGRQSDQVLFISIHADSIRKSRIRGMSIYTLSEKASDAEAEDLARRENRADLVAGHDLSGVDSPDVANILVEMALEESKRVARTFAGVLVTELSGSGVKMLSRPQRAAGFAVLKAPDIPSVLVELGYLSNQRDERLLRNADHRRKLAHALRGAIDRHFDGLKLAMAR